jgi:cytochrome c556
MKLTTRILGGAALITAIASTGFAASHLDPAAASAIKARQSHMQLYQHNLAALGNMAKGAVEYDADVASAHAADILALATMNQSGYWVPGTDSTALPDDTKASAAIWAEGSQIGAAAGGMVEAATAMNAAAGGGLESMQAAMGALGGACSTCHKGFRTR